MSLVIAKFSLVAQPILIVQNSMAMPRSIFASFSLVPQLMATASHCKLVVVIDVPQHIADHLLTVSLSLALNWFLLASA